MTVDDILRMSYDDISRMTEKEIRQATTILGSAANKRANRIAKSGTPSQALRGMEASGGKISLKGKTNINQVRGEFYRARTFMTAKTGSIKGAKDVRAEMTEIIGEDLTPKQEKRLWQVYDRLKELNPTALYSNGKYDKDAGKDLQRIISENIKQHKGYGVDRLTELLNNELTENYEAQEEQYNDDELYPIF